METMKAFPQAAWRITRMFLVAFLAYLLQVSVMPYLRIGGVTPNLMFSILAIITICYGKLRGVWIGALYGMIMEVMMPTKMLFSLLLYPVAAAMSAAIFGDKSARTLEYERSIGKAGRNITPYLRTPLCALLNVFIYEVVNITYIYLREGNFTSDTIGRGFLNLFLTTLLTIVLMVPVRYLFGYRKAEKPVDDPVLYV